MNRFLVASLSGVLMCCSGAGFMALVSENGGLAPWAGGVLSCSCNTLIGFNAIGGAAAVQSAQRAAIFLCAALAAIWTVIQAAAALFLVFALGLKLPVSGGAWLLFFATIAHLLLLAIVHRDFRAEACERRSLSPQSSR